MRTDARIARRRQEALTRLRLLERTGDPALTAFARLAAYVAGRGAAAVHVLDAEHQHRVAAVDAPLGPTSRDDSFCRLVVDGEQRIVCTDASQDGRFSYSPFATGDEPVRFYASFPIVLADATVIGALCCWDTEEHELSDEQVARLEDLATQVASRVDLLRVANDLVHASGHDPLTGAVNRLVLDDRLAMAFARRLRHGGDVLLVTLDLDGFKAVNDAHGHEAGDAVLATVAQRLRATLRAEDTIARLGGDEFAVIAELEPSGVGVDALLERVRGVFAEPVECAGVALEVAASIGTARMRPGDDVPAAFAAADRAVYADKAACRAATA